MYGIFADSRGFLWFFTGEGLSRFDGNRFITYGVAEGLPHGVVNTLIETRSGDHWVGTPRGLSRIAATGSTARFTNYRLGTDPASNNVGTLLELRSGAILAATAGGLFEWTKPASFCRRDCTGSTTSTPYGGGSHRLLMDRDHKRRICSDQAESSGFSKENGLPGNWVNMLLLDSKGRLWAALRGGLAMICRTSAGGWGVEQVYSPGSGLAGADVLALHEASDGTLWVGTTSESAG